MGWLPNNKQDRYLPETKTPNRSADLRTPREDRENHLHAVKSRLHRSLVERLDIPQLEAMEESLVATEIRRAVSQLLNDDPFPLNTEERTRLAQELEFEILGLGPLEPLVQDDTISDILVNRFDEVYIERAGKLE
jgi:pilus assembly protein CpaF